MKQPTKSKPTFTTKVPKLTPDQVEMLTAPRPVRHVTDPRTKLKNAKATIGFMLTEVSSGVISASDFVNLVKGVLAYVDDASK